MTIARLIRDRSTPIVTCTVETPVRDAVAVLAERRIGALPVLRDGTIAGIFSERDALYQLHEQGPAMLDRTVGEAMTAPAIHVAPETPILEALGLMTRRRIRHLPVVEDGRMIAFVSIGDLVKYRIDQISSEAEALRGYIQMA
jgi:CBS domain-containing protein